MIRTITVRSSVVLLAAGTFLACGTRAVAQESSSKEVAFEIEKCLDDYGVYAVEPSFVTPAYARLHEALNSPTTLDFIDQPLSDVLLFLEADKGIQIVPDNSALDELGVSTDHPVTVELRDLSMRSALELMLESLDLTYVVRDEVLFITSVDAVDDGKFHVTKVYPVADLLRRCSQAAPDYEPLVAVISSLIEPSSWRATGGAGNLLPVAGTLVISQSDQIHEQIRRLLCILRQVGDPALSPRTTIDPQTKPESGGQRRSGGGGLGRNLGLG